MGFVQIPSDLFTKFAPWCFDDYIMWSEPEHTVPALALFPIYQVLPHGMLADTSACMCDWQQKMISIFSLKFVSNILEYFVLSHFFPLAILFLCLVFLSPCSFFFPLPSCLCPSSSSFFFPYDPFPPFNSWIWGEKSESMRTLFFFFWTPLSRLRLFVEPITTIGSKFFVTHT